MKFNLLYIVLLFSALVSKAEINIAQLDAVDEKTKVYLFKDLFYKSADFKESIYIDSINHVDVNPNEWVKVVIDSMSAKASLQFFPFIAENFIMKHKDNQELIASVENHDSKTFRTILVDQFNQDDAKVLNQELLIFLTQNANKAGKVEMSSFMFKEGKVYVVVSVLSIIFTGIVLYLFSLQKKINQLKKY